MNLDQLEAFVSVATRGGFTQASRSLHRSQPAVSRRIALLEKELGARLFARRGKDIALTEPGRVLLPYAERALAEIRQGVSAVGDFQHPSLQTHPLRIVVVGTLADRQLSQALQLFRNQYPNTEVQLRTATSRETTHLVANGDADLGLRYFDQPHQRLTSVHIGTEQMILAAGAGSDYCGLVVRRARDLADIPVLSFPADPQSPDSFGNMLERELLALGLTQPKLTFVDSLTAQKRLAEAGYGIAFLPVNACTDELRSGSLVQIAVTSGKFRPSQPIFLIRRSTATRSALLSLADGLIAAF